jgi:hypothetical protein
MLQYFFIPIVKTYWLVLKIPVTSVAGLFFIPIVKTYWLVLKIPVTSVAGLFFIPIVKTKIIIILKHYIHVCTHWNMEMEWLTALYAVGENK